MEMLRDIICSTGEELMKMSFIKDHNCSKVTALVCPDFTFQKHLGKYCPCALSFTCLNS